MTEAEGLGVAGSIRFGTIRFARNIKLGEESRVRRKTALG